ncbi:TMhelix containing protein [Vibrio phage 1.087.A._10N.261.45.F9]|nr:TMhelix containing protein [Vibrio phage 1.087.A._10N.261.45.F9]
MHTYTKNAQSEWIHGQQKQSLTTGDRCVFGYFWRGNGGFMNIYAIILIAWLALKTGANIHKDLTPSGVIASLLQLAIMVWLISQI